MQLATLTFSLLWIGVSLWLLTPMGGQDSGLVRASYDSSHAWESDRARELPESRVVILYLDAASYAREQQDPNRPWSRALHARLLDRLTAEGAAVVAFDIVFSGPGPDPAADQALAASIRRHGHVVLGGELADWSSRSGTAEGVAAVGQLAPYALFREAAAAWGLTALRMDADLTARRHYGGRPSLGVAGLATEIARQAGVLLEGDGDELWLRYYGPPLTVPHLGYSAALRGEGVPAGYFKDRVVIIGDRPSVSVAGARGDEYRNPVGFRGRKQLLMPAVEIHATQVLNRLRGDGLKRLPLPVEAAVLAALAALGSGLFLRLRPWPGAGAALVLGLGATALAAAVWRGPGYWFPWLIVVGVQLPGSWLSAVAYHSVGWYRQRRQLEAEQRRADAKIREQAALLDLAQDAIVAETLDGRLEYANPAALRSYGWASDVVGSTGCLDAVSEGSPEARAAARLAVVRDGEWLGELEQRGAGGPRIMQARWTLLRDEAGRPRAVLAIHTDITEKKRLEAQFLQAQRLDTVGALAGGMAHDLNNALSPMLLGVQMLQRNETDPERRQLLEVMETNAHRGAEMVRQVLWFARGTGADRRTLEVGPLLREIERVVRQTFPSRVQVAVLAPRDLWPVRANATELHQVLLNLCVNARDAMPEGGELTLAADNLELGEAEAAALPQGRAGEFVLLVVADTGMGMSPEVQARVFEPFFTTKPVGQGTGLGLSTVARIVAAHGGFVNVRSEPGAGTTFEIHLPREVATAVQPSPSAAPGSVPPRGGRVLVVVAEHALREMIGATLRDAGFPPVLATSAGEAQAVLAASEVAPELLILDEATVREGAPWDVRCPVIWLGEVPPGCPGLAVARPVVAQALLAAVGQLRGEG
jgi:PAS domain S-box-containing protein